MTKALGRSKVVESCAEIGQTELRTRAVEKKPREVNKLKKVKFAVEAMEIEPNGAKVEGCKITMDADFGANSCRVENGHVAEVCNEKGATDGITTLTTTPCTLTICRCSC